MMPESCGSAILNSHGPNRALRAAEASAAPGVLAALLPGSRSVANLPPRSCQCTVEASSARVRLAAAAAEAANEREVAKTAAAALALLAALQTASEKELWMGLILARQPTCEDTLSC